MTTILTASNVRDVSRTVAVRLENPAPQPSRTTIEGVSAFRRPATGALSGIARDRFLRKVYVADYANGDGSDDAVGLQRAMNAAQGKRLIFAHGAEYRSSVEIKGVSNVSLDFGDSLLGSYGTSRFRSLFYFAPGLRGIKTLGGNFDTGHSALTPYLETDYPTQYNVGLYFDTCWDIQIDELELANLYTRAVFGFQCNGYFRMRRYRGSSPVQTQQYLCEHICIATCGSDITLEDIKVDNAPPTSPATGVGALLLSGTTGHVILDGIDLNYCGRDTTGGHQVSPVTFYGNHARLDGTKLRSKNSMYGFMRLVSVGGADVGGFDVSFAPNADASQPAFEVQSTVQFAEVGQLGSRDIEIHSGTISEPPGQSTNRVGVYAAAYDYSTPLTNVRFHDIDFENCKYIAQFGGPFKKLSIKDCNVRGRNGSAITVTQDAGGVPVTSVVWGPEGAGQVTEAASVCDDLEIKNITADLEHTGAVLVSIDFTNAGHSYAGTIGEIDVSDYKSSMAGVGAAQFLVYRGIPGQGRLTLRRNKPDQYAIGFDVANVEQVIIEDNAPRNVPTFYSLAGAIGTAIVRNNPGYNPVGASAIPVTASPMTYTAGPSPETLYVKGGTVTAITKGGVSLAATTNQGIQLAPNQSVVITYSVAPTMAKDVL